MQYCCSTIHKLDNLLVRIESCVGTRCCKQLCPINQEMTQGKLFAVHSRMASGKCKQRPQILLDES